MKKTLAMILPRSLRSSVRRLRQPLKAPLRPPRQTAQPMRHPPIRQNRASPSRLPVSKADEDPASQAMQVLLMR